MVRKNGYIKKIKYPFEAYFICIIAIVSTGVMTIEIIGRYAFAHSFAWSEEFVRYAFIWFTLIGSSYALKEKKHICVDGVLDWLPKKIQIGIEIFGQVLLMGTLVFLLIKSYDYTLFTMKTISKATVTKIPMYSIYLALPIGFALMCIRLVQSWINEIKEQKNYNKRGEVGQ